jgi:hypothetical protein
MYRYANAYKDMGYQFISKKVLLLSQEIAKNFEELKKPQSIELTTRSMILLARKIGGYTDMKFKFNYQIVPKVTVPFD